MKLQFKKTTIVALSVMTLAGVAVSQFEPAWAGKAVRDALIDKDLEQALCNHFKKRFFNLIDASDDQKTKLTALLNKQMEGAQPIRQQIREGLIDVSDMMADENATDEQIKQKVHEIRTLREQIQDKRLDTILEARAVLSREQKQIVSNRLKGFLTGNPRVGLRSL